LFFSADPIEGKTRVITKSNNCDRKAELLRLKVHVKFVFGWKVNSIRRDHANSFGQMEYRDECTFAVFPLAFKLIFSDFT